ncbi:ADYC domain-containing protein [Nannocystis sp. ILAH1]|uniref:ADYC domain-containing protein n=1 Tax=unclassified Nannocystis TaxID=2627009 RepID=UPI00226F98B8|nr:MULTISPECIES: ADYC domain-containing protein [unclassified Nannocystis]MCY0991326.1 ADYC domain-containing protein [Nannocystis sp. ILAH1]MCY1066374.1 ADYC domain-containing protein [Nannocystis sp. RBIL2]
MRSPVASLLASLLLIACAPEDDDVELRGVLITGGNSGGGTVFNTHALDNQVFSELEPLGEPHVGPGLDSVNLAGNIEVLQLAEEGGELVGYDWLGHKYSGEALLGSQWIISFSSGLLEIPMFLLHIDDEGAVPHYQFYHHKGETSETELPNCPEGKYGPGHARVLSGLSVDEDNGEVSEVPGLLYLACDTGATGKAADLGYYDWARSQGDLELFETAIRVLRADYCYDGQSHTKPGVELVLEDRWGIHGPSPEHAMDPVEAVWGPNGLLCHGKGRLTDIACLSKRKVPECPNGTTFETYQGAQYITRLHK